MNKETLEKSIKENLPVINHKSFTKFFKRHSAIIEKYGTTLREIRLAIQN